MKLPEAWARYTELTTSASDRVRQLAFAGIAIVWLFRDGERRFGLNAWLACTLLFFALGLLADVAQPLVAAQAWRAFTRKNEISLYKKHDKNLEKANAEEIALPPKFHAIPTMLFWLRNGFVAAGYMLLVGHLGLFGLNSPEATDDPPCCCSQQQKAP